MSGFTKNELKERWNEGLKCAVSRAKEMAICQKYEVWNTIAFQLDGIRRKGLKMISDKAMTQQEVLKAVNDHQRALKIDNNSMLNGQPIGDSKIFH